jgi:3-methyladenine DNA glycosylase AlkD
MPLDDAIAKLQAPESAKVRVQNAKGGAGDDQFGVNVGDIRALAKAIRTDGARALALWDTGNVDARCLPGDVV